MSSPLKVAMIASECVPFAKTGGLADVAGSLPAALTARGHEVIVIMPKYADIPFSKYPIERFLGTMGVWMGGNTLEWCSVFRHITSAGVPVFFIEYDAYFNRPGLYHDAAMHDFRDNPRRFAFFTRAALQLCKDMSFSPHIVHAHDWMTAPVAAYLKVWHWNDSILGRAASVVTIHNVAYQGIYGVENYDYMGLQWSNFTSDKFEDHGRINCLKGGIAFADIVNTVSPNYAREITSTELSFGMAPSLHRKGRGFLGILNGVDYTEWNPETDRLIPANYSKEDRSNKAVCKRELQRRMDLDIDPDVPIIGVVSRFADQKGLDLLASIIERVVREMRVQFAILGSGDKALEGFFGPLPARYPGRIGTYIGYSNELAHWIEAGSDFFAMPSIYEPCGLNQIYSLKYGTLPIVRATGGLDDTVENYNEATGDGTGFKFVAAESHALYYTIGWAVSTYYDRRHHMRMLIGKAMEQDFSWERSAVEYESAYAAAMRNHG